MKHKEVTGKDDAGLLTELAEKRKQLFALRTQAVTDKLDDPTQLGKTRRDIARILTVQRQRLVTAAASAPAVAVATH